MAGLASLTENYTDSEEEDSQFKDSPTSEPPSLLDKIREATESKDNTPISISSKHSFDSRSNRSTPVKKPARLVSYIDPEDEDDLDPQPENPTEEDDSMDLEQNTETVNREDKNFEPVPMDLDSESGSTKKEDSDDQTLEEESTKTEKTDSVTGIEVEAWTEGVKLPPEPTGQCSAKLQENINRLWKKKKETGFDTNAAIQNKKAFRNPSIYEQLIQFCGIDEQGTNFPKELYDGHLFGKESYYDELAKVQKAEMDRREKAKDRTSAGGLKSAVEAASAAAAQAVKKLDDSGAKRKSKWDQVQPLAAPGIAAIRPTTIPAFGNLIKKH